MLKELSWKKWIPILDEFALFLGFLLNMIEVTLFFLQLVNIFLCLFHY